jgi:DinB superfamily
MSGVSHSVPHPGDDPCPACGYRFTGDLVSTADRARTFPEVLAMLLDAADSATVRHRTEPRVWSPLEFGAHVGEAVDAYLDRVDRVLSHDRPRLEPVDWVRAAEIGEYRRRSVQRVLHDVEDACGRLADVAATVSPEELGRQGVGSDDQPRTVELLITRADHELAHHEHDLRRLLSRACR